MLPALPALTGRKKAAWAWQQEVFRLARRLQAKGYGDLTSDAVQDELREWHAALDRPPHTLVESFLELARCWAKVRCPEGTTLGEILDRAGDEPLPRQAGPAGQDPHAAALIRICRALSRHHQRQPFPLSCRTAGQLIGVSSVRAHELLWALVGLGIIVCVEVGSLRKLSNGKRTASTWRYLCD